jgi:NAD(P)-dependent dehydrogenase (short-subunit alcohol dehydrogenase family)
MLVAVLALVASIDAKAPRSVICVGGSSGMGKAAATSVVARGGRVLCVSRSAEKLAAARSEIVKVTGCVDVLAVQTYVMDASDEDAVKEFANSALLAEFAPDGLVVSAAGAAPHGPITALPTEDTHGLFGSKFWSAYHSCKHLAPLLADGGSIALVAGLLNRRPGINCVPLASVNGALEGLTRALALEFGPRLRVNCLSPGFCDTERFDRMDPEKKDAMLANTAESLPLKRVGQPADMGMAIDFLLCSPFTTGVVLDCDGGHHIRQYASPGTDPMRAAELEATNSGNGR